MSMAASQSGWPSDGGGTQPLYRGLDMATQLADRSSSPYFRSPKFEPRLFLDFLHICSL